MRGGGRGAGVPRTHSGHWLSHAEKRSFAWKIGFKTHPWCIVWDNREPFSLLYFSFSNSQLPLTRRLPLIARIFITYNTRSRLNISIFNTEPVCRGDAPHTDQYLIQQGLENNLKTFFQQRSADLKCWHCLKAVACEFPNLIDMSPVLKASLSSSIWQSELTAVAGKLLSEKDRIREKMLKAQDTSGLLIVGTFLSWRPIPLRVRVRVPLRVRVRVTWTLTFRRNNVLPRRKVAELNLLPHAMAGGGAGLLILFACMLQIWT